MREREIEKLAQTLSIEIDKSNRIYKKQKNVPFNIIFRSFQTQLFSNDFVVVVVIAVSRSEIKEIKTKQNKKLPNIKQKNLVFFFFQIHFKHLFSLYS